MENPQKTTNRRGQKSRQEILDAASRVMSAYGYASTSMSALVDATGIPKSSIYHHFGSKAGLLAEVMAEGARGFFAAMQEAHREPQGDTPRERLGWYLKKAGEVFQNRENFLRLMLVMVMSNEAAEPEALQMVIRVRNEGRDYMCELIQNAFSLPGEVLASDVVVDIAHFGMLGFDGAFVSLQSGDRRSMNRHMELLAEAMIAIGEARRHRTPNIRSNHRRPEARARS
ncbi:MAG TPA: TetR/AcrR family transcriptional regulator [Paraburkholderia sp.]|uniref:TetR/AcrR family transcriptional regulator n=1 Tax=Paraburkholderia sp. TaxID=1926495 RepID=UPI002B45ED1F|nr:TetR/AcrR family transcriptional regulator [Paraburkholderia sp.]HKR47671.1 TetR/AcrR family transcriptional regulator [Paraburkholderia sp.]